MVYQRLARRLARRLRGDDLRVDLLILQRVAAEALAKMRPPAGIIYKRITPDFFVVSSIRKDRIWYNRCNRGNGVMNCVLINYPAAEKLSWDSVVIRISHSLRG